MNIEVKEGQKVDVLIKPRSDWLKILESMAQVYIQFKTNSFTQYHEDSSTISNNGKPYVTFSLGGKNLVKVFSGFIDMLTKKIEGKDIQIRRNISITEDKETGNYYIVCRLAILD